MKKFPRLAAVSALALLSACASADSHDQLMKDLVQGEPEVGPQPDKMAGAAMIEAAVKQDLKDPYSAQFSWPNDFRKGWYKPLLKPRVYGWYTCGSVNAKNGYGGYGGREAVIGVIASGHVVYFDIDQGRYPLIGPQCAKAGMPAY